MQIRLDRPNKVTDRQQSDCVSQIMSRHCYFICLYKKIYSVLFWFIEVVLQVSSLTGIEVRQSPRSHTDGNTQASTQEIIDSLSWVYSFAAT
jgi:hypothetical protein